MVNRVAANDTPNSEDSGGDDGKNAEESHVRGNYVGEVCLSRRSDAAKECKGD